MWRGYWFMLLLAIRQDPSEGDIQAVIQLYPPLDAAANWPSRHWGSAGDRSSWALWWLGPCLRHPDNWWFSRSYVVRRIESANAGGDGKKERVVRAWRGKIDVDVATIERGNDEVQHNPRQTECTKVRRLGFYTWLVPKGNPNSTTTRLKMSKMVEKGPNRIKLFLVAPWHPTCHFYFPHLSIKWVIHIYKNKI